MMGTGVEVFAVAVAVAVAATADPYGMTTREQATAIERAAAMRTSRDC
jgi:hypothetical protein